MYESVDIAASRPGRHRDGRPGLFTGAAHQGSGVLGVSGNRTWAIGMATWSPAVRPADRHPAPTPHRHRLAHFDDVSHASSPCSVARTCTVNQPADQRSPVAVASSIQMRTNAHLG